MTTYQVGDQVAVVVNFTNTAGTPETPTIIAAWYRRPGEAATDTATTTEDVGQVVLQLPPFDVGGSGTNGKWRWGVAGTAGVVAAVEGSIQVAASSKET